MSNNNITDTLSEKAFDCLSHEKKQTFSDLIQRLQDLSFDEAVNELIKFYETMPQSNISQSQQQEMIEAVLSKMPKENQRKIRFMLSALCG